MHKFTEEFSDEEQEARDDFMRELYIKLEFFKDEIREDCGEIGGHFRGPGMMSESCKMVKDMLEQLRGSSFSHLAPK